MSLPLPLPALPPPPTPLCPHFGECGGCLTQDVPYPEQVARKQAALTELFREVWPGPLPVAPSPRVWYYRNKIELKYDRRHYPEPPPKDFVRETVLGFRRRNRWNITLDLAECRLFAPELPALLARLGAWQRAAGVPHYQPRRDVGCLRHLVLRAGQRTGERLACLITAPGPFNAPPFVAAVHAAWPGASVLRGEHAGVNDMAVAETIEVLAGQPCVHEELVIPGPAGERHLRFRIPPFGFFQVNPGAVELLYGAIRAGVRERPPARLYDLYGGAGAIALVCADLCGDIVSVDSFPAAAADGATNLALDGVTHVQMVTAPVEDWLPAATLDPAATAVLDPPRQGLHPRVVETLVNRGPRELFYVSCHPEALARELPLLLAAYRLTSLAAFDLFPHTPHVELLARLERRMAT